MDLVMTNGYTPQDSIFRRWNAMLSDIDPTATRISALAADVVEDADGYHFQFEAPGIDGGSVDVRVEDGTLVVEAERKRPEYPKESHVLLAERTYGKMRRAFTMPEDANHEGIKASYKDGVLDVTAPKRPESKPVKIKVEVKS
ncbi:MAG TPA: HSP20 family small heat-shock protein [Candidatus Binataceae bacterium]|nr:HSP20 family small heat-shock protein [Candidatus Binataceae bacterium]